MPPARRNLFYLAEKLGIPVGELEARLSISEYFEWLQYFNAANTPAEPNADNILKGFGL